MAYKSKSLFATQLFCMFFLPPARHHFHPFSFILLNQMAPTSNWTTSPPVYFLNSILVNVSHFPLFLLRSWARFCIHISRCIDGTWAAYPSRLIAFFFVNPATDSFTDPTAACVNSSAILRNPTYSVKFLVWKPSDFYPCNITTTANHPRRHSLLTTQVTGHHLYRVCTVLLGVLIYWRMAQ